MPTPVRIGPPPDVCASLDADAEVLRRYVDEAEGVLATLPPKSDRSEEQTRSAEEIFGACRRLRSSFMHRHASEVYDVLTAGRIELRRMSELAFAAAERFAGLVPTRAQIGTERRSIQTHKEGREIDQGIFFRALLRSPSIGAHLMDAMLLPSAAAEAHLAELVETGSVRLETMSIERRGHAAYLTIEHPQALNAEDDRLVADMETAVDLALLDDKVRVGVLRGGTMSHPKYAGRRVFSAGINLRALHAGQISFVDFLLGRELGYIRKIYQGLLVDRSHDALTSRTIQKPWVAAVDTFAIGGGMQLLFAFDHVIAEDGAYFCLPAAQEGIVPGVANLRLTRRVGGRLARQIILGGRKVSARDAAAASLCDEVVPSAGVDDAIATAVENLDNPAVVANRRMLHLAEEPDDRLREYVAEFAFVQATRLYSKDVIDKVGRAWARGSRA